MDISKTLLEQGYSDSMRILFYDIYSRIDSTSMKIFHDIQERQHDRGTRQKQTDNNLIETLPGDVDLEVISLSQLFFLLLLFLLSFPIPQIDSKVPININKQNLLFIVFPPSLILSFHRTFSSSYFPSFYDIVHFFVLQKNFSSKIPRKSLQAFFIWVEKMNSSQVEGKKKIGKKLIFLNQRHQRAVYCQTFQK